MNCFGKQCFRVSRSSENKNRKAIVFVRFVWDAVGLRRKLFAPVLFSEVSVCSVSSMFSARKSYGEREREREREREQKGRRAEG